MFTEHVHGIVYVRITVRMFTVGCRLFVRMFEIFFKIIFSRIPTRNNWTLRKIAAKHRSYWYCRDSWVANGFDFWEGEGHQGTVASGDRKTVDFFRFREITVFIHTAGMREQAWSRDGTRGRAPRRETSANRVLTSATTRERAFSKSVSNVV